MFKRMFLLTFVAVLPLCAAIVQIDTENADRDITSLITVLTATPDASNPMLCQGYVAFGDGAKNLDGTGGDFSLVITVGGQTIEPSPQDITFSTAVRAGVWTTQFPVPANTEVILRALSPNAADTDVDVVAYLYQVDAADMIAINGDLTSGYNATLKLSQLDIQAQASNEPAINLLGNGTAAGLETTGGSGGGDGFLAVGNSAGGATAGGSGIHATSPSGATGTSSALFLSSASQAGHAIRAEATGASGSGLYLSSTSQQAVNMTAASPFGTVNITNTNAVNPDAAAVRLNGGSVAPGMKIDAGSGGASTAAGLLINGGASAGAGMELNGGTGGKDIDADEIDSIVGKLPQTAFLTGTASNTADLASNVDDNYALIETNNNLLDGGSDDLATINAAVAALPSSATVADSVWDAVQSGHSTAGTFGLYLDTQISSLPSAAVVADSVLSQTIDTGFDLTGSVKRILSVQDGDVTAASNVHTFKDKDGTALTVHDLSVDNTRTVTDP